jgi:uncharacterized phage protein (TIGR02218 family)
VTFDAREKSAMAGAPIELFRFTCGALVYTYTSADADQVYGGQTYSATRLVRGAIDYSNEDQRGALEIKMLRTVLVADLFIPDLPPHPVTLEFFRFHRGDSETVLAWAGQVASANFIGSEVTFTALPASQSFRRSVPGNSFQNQCNWTLFSTQCGLVKASYVVSAVTSLISGTTVRSPAFAGFADGYFRSGWMEGPDGESHWITDHVGDTLTLFTPFRALVTGATVNAYPGCDRTITACKAFGNLSHHLGFPFIPSTNPFVQGIG